MSIENFNSAIRSESEDELLSALRTLAEAEQPLRPVGSFIWQTWI